MDSAILLQRMLVLFIMVVIGIYSYKKNIIDDHTCRKITSLIVNVLNPMLIISGVLGEKMTGDKLIFQNILVYPSDCFKFLICETEKV